MRTATILSYLLLVVRTSFNCCKSKSSKM